MNPLIVAPGTGISGLVMFAFRLLRRTELSFVPVICLAGFPPSARCLPPTVPHSIAVNSPIERAMETLERQPSNVIIDLEIHGPYLWAATGAGVGRFLPASGTGNPASGTWAAFGEEEGLGAGGVSGIAVGTTVHGDTIIWAATAIDTSISGENYSAGGGVGFSIDMGQIWTWMPQPVDSIGSPDISPTTTNILNVTYDIAILGNRVWISSWGGGLRYLDMEADSLYWINRPPDTLSFDAVSNLNHRAFSVVTMDTLLWVGTAGGINLSRDGGSTWRNFPHIAVDEATPSGNFVNALGAQITSTGKRIIWASTWSTGNESEYTGVSMSEDLGITWRRVLGSPEDPIRSHNFAFDDSVVYVATEKGLYKSIDFGNTWGVFPPVYDSVTQERAYLEELFSVAVGLDRLWVGSAEGLAVSGNGGNTWRLMRSYPVPGTGTVPEAYAYPVPFSPSRFPVVRFQYRLKSADTVTLEIYDFAMELVARPVRDVHRPAGVNTEVWNGLGPGGRTIANGAYFFRISGGGQERWGKLLVLD